MDKEEIRLTLNPPHVVLRPMERFTEGNCVRVDIPNETDPDHKRYHGLHGTVVDVLEDDADRVTGDKREGLIYRIELENGETADFRWRDLRPAIE